MNLAKLRKLRWELANLRQRPNNIRSNELVRIAESLGRVRFPRGKELTYINQRHRSLRPLSIPHHPGNLKKATALSIISQLEGDIDFLEQQDEGEDCGNRASS